MERRGASLRGKLRKNRERGERVEETKSRRMRVVPEENRRRKESQRSDEGEGGSQME